MALRRTHRKRQGERELGVVNYQACLRSTGGHPQERRPVVDTADIILNKSCSQFVEIFSRGAELYTTMSGPSWEQLRDRMPPKGEEVDA